MAEIVTFAMEQCTAYKKKGAARHLINKLSLSFLKILLRTILNHGNKNPCPFSNANFHFLPTLPFSWPA